MSETFSNGGETSKAEDKAAKRDAQKAARETASAERAEQKAAKKAERRREAAQKKVKEGSAKKRTAKTAAADDEAEQGAEESSEVAATSETTDPSTLPAKVTKEKKPKKARKASASKEVRRAIRPIRSKSQQTTARLIWAVFGMALVIVAIVGFWVVISNQDDNTEVTLLVTARDLTKGNFLEAEDIARLTRDDDGTAYLPAANEAELYGRVILQDIPENTPLQLFMFGEVVATSPETGEAEITFPLEFPGTAGLPGTGEAAAAGISPGDRVVIFVTVNGQKRVFDVVDVANFSGNVEIAGTYEDRAEWERRLSAYQGTETETVYQFELERVDSANSPYPIVCFKERFGNIYPFDTTVPGYPEPSDPLELIECPPEWVSSSEQSPPPSDTVAPAPSDTAAPEGDSFTPSSDIL